MPGHVYLTGFMCSGKSTVGRALAGRLALPFHDLDRAVEACVGPLLPYVQREGEEAFREQEARVLRELASRDRAVIACGGGTPLRPANRSLMRRTGRVIFLDAPLSVLMPRIERAGGDRPLLFGLTGTALRERVEALLAARMPVYRLAHSTVPAGGRVEEVVAAIVATLADQVR